MGIRARLAALLLVLGTGAVAVDVPVEVQALADAQAKTTSLAGTFRWFTGTVDGSGEVRERMGEFQVVRRPSGAPSKYNLKLTDLEGADVHRWCSDGVKSWAIEQPIPEELPTWRELRPGAHDLDLDRIVACVLMDMPVLTRDFSMRFSDREGIRRLVFTPLSADLRQELVQVIVTLAGDDPREVLMDDTKGTRIRLVIKELAKDREWPDIVFSPLPKQP